MSWALMEANRTKCLRNFPLPTKPPYQLRGILTESESRFGSQAHNGAPTFGRFRCKEDRQSNLYSFLRSPQSYERLPPRELWNKPWILLFPGRLRADPYTVRRRFEEL